MNILKTQKLEWRKEASHWKMLMCNCASPFLLLAKEAKLYQSILRYWWNNVKSKDVITINFKIEATYSREGGNSDLEKAKRTGFGTPHFSISWPRYAYMSILLELNIEGDSISCTVLYVVVHNKRSVYFWREFNFQVPDLNL